MKALIHIYSLSSRRYHDLILRQVTELCTTNQNLRAVISEKERQVEEARRVRDRSLSQNRQAQLRREEAQDAEAENRRGKKKHKKKHSA